MQGLGNVAEVRDTARDEIYHAVSARLAVVPAPALTFRLPVLHREAVVLPPTDPGPLRLIRGVIRAGIADVWGSEAVPEPVSYRPHFSIAYVNTDERGARVLDRLRGVSPDPVVATLTHASLIELRREDSCYKWTQLRAAPLAPPQGAVTA